MDDFVIGFPDEAEMLANEVATKHATVGEEVVDRMQNAIRSTEESVLAIGQLLNQIVDVATEDLDEVRASLGLSQSGSDLEGNASSAVEQTIRVQSDLVSSFVGELSTFLQRQAEFSEAATQACSRVTDCANSVADLMDKSNVLALNMQIESARLGTKGNAFSTIGDEMKHFSREVSDANKLIVDALDDLTSALPSIQAEMTGMQTRAQEFSDELAGKMADVERQTGELNHSLNHSIERAQAKNDEILSVSQQTLSHLQFQDPVAQDLQKAEKRVQQMQTILSENGLDEQVLEAAGEESTAVEDDRASGEVDLF